MRWVDARHLADTTQPLGQAGPPVRATVLPNATLHDALEELLMSNAGQAVVVDEHRRYQGIVDVGSLADVLKRMRADAQKHYELLAADEALARGAAR
jgi:osmoprotectant transport system ATP-binding protein